MKRLTLPFPPTLNTYYKPLRAGNGARIVLRPEARSYRERVVGMLRHVGHPLEGRLRMRATLHWNSRDPYDLDNRMKGLLDAMEHAGVFLNDAQIDELTVTRGHIADVPHVVVEIGVIT